MYRPFGKDPILYFFISLMIAVAALYIYAKTILVLFFVTVLLCILLDPVVNRVSHTVSRGTAAALVLLSFIGMFAVIMGIVLKTVVPDLAKFAKEFPGLIKQFDTAVLTDFLPAEFADYGKRILHDASVFAVTIVKQSVGPLLHAFSGVAEMIAVPFITFYLLKDGRSIIAGIASYCSAGIVFRATPFFADIGNVLGGYIRGQMLIAAFSGSIVFIVLSIFGLPYVAVLAVLAALCEFVPVIGAVVATVPSVLIALTVSPLIAAKVLVFYIILLKINHNIIYPKVVGEAIKVHPVFIMTTVLLFGHLFGVIGMLFAVPGVAITRVWLIHLLKK